MDLARFLANPEHARAPAQSVWNELSPEERRRVVESLPSDIERTAPPEGDPHRISKTRAFEMLEQYYRSIRRSIYLSAELPVYYPDEPMFAPDLIAVVDVAPHERMRWVVSAEGRGLDFALEVHVSGDARKDVVANVERFAKLGIPEYFAFDPVRQRLLGWRLPTTSTSRYEPILPQEGRWHSSVLELDLALEEGRLRFFHGSAALLDAQELIARLSNMVDNAARRAEEEARRAKEEAWRAEEQARRADRLAARLRELGVDPDAI